MSKSDDRRGKVGRVDGEPQSPTTTSTTNVADAAQSPVAAKRQRSSLQLVMRGGAWTTLSQLAPLAVNVVMTPYVIHGFGVPRYGLFLLCTTITTFFGSFDGGIGTSMARYTAVYAASNDKRAATTLVTTMTSVVAVVGLASFAAMYVLAPLALAAFRIPADLRGEGVFLVRAMAVIVALAQVRALFSAQLSGRQKYALQSVIGMASYAIYAAGLVVTVEGHHGLRGVAVTFLVQAAFATILIIALACRYLVRQGVHLLNRTETIAFLRYASSVQLLGLTGMVTAQLDTFVVGAMLPISSVAVYNSGANFSNQLRGVPVNALSPMATVLSREYGSGGHAAAKAEFGRLQKAWVRGVTGWSAVGVGAAYFGVSSWLGPDFRLSGVVALLLVASNAVNLWTGPLTVLTAAVGRPQLEARYGIVGLLINIVLTVPFIFAFGLLGTVAATAIGQIVGSLYLLRIVHRRYDAEIPSFLKDVPLVQAIFATGFVVLCELVAAPVVPRGPLGLLLAGAIAFPGLVLYAVGVVGPRRSLRLARGRLSRSASAVV